MKKNALFILFLSLMTLVSCNDDENSENTPIAVAFVNPTANITADETPVNVVLSSPAPAAGTIVLNVTPVNLAYGIDYTTNPAVVGNTISVPFAAGASSAVFTFTKLIDAIEGEVKNVTFTIASVSLTNVEIPVDTKVTTLNFNETAMESNTTLAENGGNTFPNQVYIDLSSGAETPILRTAWDLGFYSGADFRVSINGAINKLAVKQLATTNIDEVQAEDPAVTTGNFDASNMAYVDAPYGNINGTAIAEISANDADNKVYLVNLGQDVAATPASGTSAALTGANRGWKKVRILRSGEGYKLQYANIDATTHTEVIIPKSAGYNYTFFSLVNGATVAAEPLASKWDINITTFTGETFYGSGESAGAYYFPDYAVTNTKAGTKAYQVLTSEFTYEAFTLANVNSTKLSDTAAGDQRAIGANWRSTMPLSIRTDRFYVVKDSAGNIYKLKFNAMLGTAGDRGHITFEYQLLQ